MKSDEEFIACIYKKAEAYQREHAKQEEDNVIRISSFQHKIKKVSTYAAGIAACFVCGIVAYLGGSINNNTDKGNLIPEGRQVELTTEISPMTVEHEKRTDNFISTYEDEFHRMQCTVIQIQSMNGTDQIKVVTSDGENATLLVPSENRSKIIEVGNEIVVSVSEAASDGNYTIASNESVYLYSGTKDGEKIFTDDSNAILKESEINTAD